MRTERRKGNQANPQDKANYLVIAGLFVTAWVLLLKVWPEPHIPVVFNAVCFILGIFGNYLTGRTHNAQQSDAGVNAGTVEHMTVRPDASQSEYREEMRKGDTEELTLDKRRRLGIP
jgi:hypothetical protein